MRLSGDLNLHNMGSAAAMAASVAASSPGRNSNGKVIGRRFVQHLPAHRDVHLGGQIVDNHQHQLCRVAACAKVSAIHACHRARPRGAHDPAQNGPPCMARLCRHPAS